jgi:ACS family glucarate transporter-like MFS transporter
MTFVMLRWGWRAALLASALPALAAAAAWFAWRAPEHRAAPGAGDFSLRALPRTRAFYLLSLSYTLQGYVGYIFVFWFYLYLVDVRGFSLLRGAALASMPWLLSIVSIPLGGYIFDRLGARRRLVPIAGLAGSGLFIAWGAYARDPYTAAATLALATALVLSVEGPFWATMTEIAGPHCGAAGGAMNFGSNIGGLISPALTPILARLLGWEAALLISAALAITAALLWLPIPPKQYAEV